MASKHSPKKGKSVGPKSPFFRQLILVLLVIVAISFLAPVLFGGDRKLEHIPISTVAEQIRLGNLEEITVEGDKLTVTLTEMLPDDPEDNDEQSTEIAIEENPKEAPSIVDGVSLEDLTEREKKFLQFLGVVKKEDAIKYKSKKPREAALEEILAVYGVAATDLEGITIEVISESGFTVFLFRVLPSLLPLIFLVILIWFIARSMKGAGMQAFNFGQSKARITDPRKQKITFKDVAGNESAKQELLEVVDFLKNPKKFLDIGAQIPKGVLLMGEPGTGKTLLARAVAGEAKVPFFHLSGSEFVEMFVGVGASRVRDLFKMAKKASPAIIFIDEIDAVGRSRGVGIGGGNDEREQTLNQILVEMDGFEPSEKLIVVAATNRADVLDPALLRPGRFDRRVMLDVPDRKDREAILNIHARKKPLAEDVDLSVIATRTPGFSGADLQSLMNEGAILAAREDRKTVSQYDLIRSIEKVMIGPERKSHLHTEKERKIVAYHEAGHAIVASALPNADPVHKVSIVARGRAGGYTLKLPLEERKLQSKKEFLDDIAMSLGGYVAERMIFNDITTGPSNDLQVATRMARSMVTKWGMSNNIGPIALEGSGGQAMFGPGMERREHSERVEAMIDEEVSLIMNNGMKVAEDTLKKHKKALEAVADALLDKETVEQEEYDAIITAHGIMPKKKEE